MLKIDTDFCGGNAVIEACGEDSVHFRPDQRDSESEWFYWAFRVTGAAGRTIRFSMAPRSYVGYFGAAYSHDLEHWRWSGGVSADRTGFTYTFAPGENAVFFAHHMLYPPFRFIRFAELHGLRVRTLCEDTRGTPIPYTVIGSGSRNILVCARHHCCESTGNSVMEGIMEEFLAAPIPDCRLTVVPFVDADGTVAGDQGKNRRPHDHNRDYLSPIYPGVRAIRDIAQRGDLLAAFDLHAPWHLSGRNDTLFCVSKLPEQRARLARFSQLFEEAITPDAASYHASDNIPLGVEWNQDGPHYTCATFCGDCGAALAFTLESAYFGREDGIPITQERLTESGRCFLRAFARLLRESDTE